MVLLIGFCQNWHHEDVATAEEWGEEPFFQRFATQRGTVIVVLLKKLIPPQPIPRK